jgi:hypothetical protein
MDLGVATSPGSPGPGHGARLLGWGVSPTRPARTAPTSPRRPRSTGVTAPADAAEGVPDPVRARAPVCGVAAVGRPDSHRVPVPADARPGEVASRRSVGAAS